MTPQSPDGQVNRWTALTGSEIAVALPRLWLSGVMKPAWVGEWCGDYEAPGTATYSVMGPGWGAVRIRDFVGATGRTRGRGLLLNPGRWRLVMYREDETSADRPVGVIAFTPSIFLTSSSRFIAAFGLDIDLMWVPPAARGQGYGKHLVAHLLRYLEKNPITACGRRVNTWGITVVVRGNRRSPAARSTMQYIDDFFELQREMTVNGEVGFSRHWGVRFVQLEER